MELTREYLNYIAEIAPGNSAINQIRGQQIIALYTSPDLHRLVGMSPDEFKRTAQSNAADLVVPDDMKGFSEKIQECILTKKQFSYSWRARNPEQEFVWLFGTTSYLGEVDGCPVMLSSFGVSSQAMNLYKDIIDTSDTMAFVCDADTYEMLYANRAARDYAGGMEVRMLGKACYQYIRGKSGPCEDCCIDASHCVKNSSQVRFSPMQGRWEKVTSKSINWGGRNALIHYIQDITESKNYQKMLEESEKRYTTAVNSADLTVWEYHIKEHAIVFGSNCNRKHGFPRRLENVPESLILRVGEENRRKMTEFYQRIDAGKQNLSEEITWYPVPGQPSVSERVFYTVTRDLEGNPDIAYGISMDITAQKLEERQFEEALQALFAANPDALCSYQLNLTKNLCLDRHGKSAYILNALQSDTADGLFGNAGALIIDPAKKELFKQTFNCRALIGSFESGKMALHIDYRRYNESRKLIWVRTFANMLRNPDTGDITAIIYSVDITREIIQTRIAHIIANQAYDYIMILYLDTERFEMEALSDGLSREFDDHFESGGQLYDFGLLQEMSLRRLADKRDLQAASEAGSVQHIRSAMEQHGYYEFIIPVRFYDDTDDKVRYRKFQHFYLSREDHTVLILGSDVSEAILRQKQEEAAVRAKAEYIQNIIDSVHTGICVLRMSDPDHMQGDFVNLQMLRILGFIPPESPDARLAMMADPKVSAYLADPFLAVYPEDRERVRKAYRDNYDAKYFDAGNYRMIRQDGSIVWVNQNAALRETGPGYRVFYASCRVVDREVELQVKLEGQLIREQELRHQAEVANLAKTDFLSRMSHDIRTPLNGIIGMTYLARSENDMEKVKGALEKIDISSKFLLGLINDVLDMSKAESGKIELHPEPYPYPEFISYMESVIKPLVAEKNQTIEYAIRLPEQMIPVQDKLRFNQIVFNILSNAVKFTPEGGQIRFTVNGNEDADGRMHLSIMISDNGIGMSEPFQKIIFDPFSQEARDDNSSVRGTGLGMAITKRLVDLMGGTIRVESTLGSGTTFYVDIPVGTATGDSSIHSKPGDKTEENISEFSGKYILLCEDHPLNQEIAKKLLEEKGLIVTIAEDGKAGLEMFKKSPIGFYNAILMDLRMPVMDGIAATREIRSLDRPDAKTVPIIATTADAFSEDVKRCMEAGMNGHIAKPIDPVILYRTLHMNLETHR